MKDDPSKATGLHVPVLVKEVLDVLKPSSPHVYVDCTVGDGGHAQRIAERCAPEGIVIGIDRDPEALAVATRRLACFAPRVRLARGSFGDLRRILGNMGISDVHGILFDLGSSSRQLDDPGRGFSYKGGGPLDMRMDPDLPIKASDIVNSWDERSLAEAFFRFGEERWSRRIAAFICARRSKKPFETTQELVEAIKDAIPASARRKGGHPARRVFQALRIVVNDELGQLEEGLLQAVEALRAGGRIAVISYHSLEDRLVKTRFMELAQRGVLKLLRKKAVTPGVLEVALNPRSRSAKLRGAEKL